MLVIDPLDHLNDQQAYIMSSARNLTKYIMISEQFKIRQHGSLVEQLYIQRHEQRSNRYSVRL